MYELSSDSDDGCYDKFPQKLLKLKSKHALNNPLKPIETKYSNVNVPNDIVDVSVITIQDSDVILLPDENNEVTSFTPIADTPLEGVSTRSRRAKRSRADIEVSPVTPSKRGGKRGKGRGIDAQPSIPSVPASRGRGRRGRGRGAQIVNQNAVVSVLTPSPRRGRGRRGRRQIPSPWDPQSIIYSIGNTDEYPDASDHQELFSNKSSKETPVSEVQEINPSIDLDESLDNEELSIKVYWQHSEVIKFNIRRLQKLTQIFDYFVKREGISRDRLLFTYNYKRNSNKILQPDDTPDSINYNIAKFIEGGIVNKEFRLGAEKSLLGSPQKKGFVIKFQCQSKKKPLEMSVNKDGKLQLAMVKCAEALEIPIAKLIFEFDGEIVHGNITPNDLEMESGDCIDVKIMNVNK